MTMREMFGDLSDADYEKLIDSMCVGPHDYFQTIRASVSPKSHTPEAQECQKAAAGC